VVCGLNQDRISVLPALTSHVAYFNWLELILPATKGKSVNHAAIALQFDVFVYEERSCVI
jgi:hypothetical protein